MLVIVLVEWFEVLGIDGKIKERLPRTGFYTIRAFMIGF